MYGRQANSNGTLGVDPSVHKFPVALQEHISGRSGFIDFTHAALAFIAEEMGKAFLASGGYALFLRYEVDAQDFMLVVMLKLKPGAGIDAATLDLTETLNIDLSLLHEAARINLTRWRLAQQPYLTFIKGRTTSRSEVSDYFQSALACTNYTDSRHHTEAIIRAAKGYVVTRSDLTVAQKKEEIIDVRRRLYECLHNHPDEVSLTALAVAVHSQAPEDFIAHVQARRDEYHLDDRFKPDRKSYIGLRRVAGKIGTVSLSFDVADVHERRVRYDESTNTIVISGPSPHLIEEIKQNDRPSDDPPRLDAVAV